MLVGGKEEECVVINKSNLKFVGSGGGVVVNGI